MDEDSWGSCFTQPPFYWLGRAGPSPSDRITRLVLDLTPPYTSSQPDDWSTFLSSLATFPMLCGLPCFPFYLALYIVSIVKRFYLSRVLYVFLCSMFFYIFLFTWWTLLLLFILSYPHTNTHTHTRVRNKCEKWRFGVEESKD